MSHVKLKILDDRAIHPQKGTKQSACWDLFAIEDTDFEAGEIKLVKTGIAMEAPQGWRFNMYVRSSTPLKKKFILANGVGIIDADYRGELMVQLMNVSTCPDPKWNNGRMLRVNKVQAGDKIAQIELVRDVSCIPESHIEVVEELSDTVRGSGGFGSTGD